MFRTALKANDAGTQVYKSLRKRQSMTKRIVIALLWLSAFALGQQTQLGNVSVKALTVRSLAGSNGCLNITAGLVGSTGVACGSGGGGGSMTWPGGIVSGIPAYSYPNAWGTTYNSSNQIPTNFLAILGSTNTFTGANTFGTTFFNNAATFYSTLQVNSATTSLFGNLYIGQNIYANAQPNGLSGAFSSLGSLATLSTQNAQNWHAEGQYGGFAVSQTNTMALIFGNSGSISGGRLHASWNGGGDNTIGYLTDPISGNAGTASALVTTPTQCSGAGNFATGIQANGNANCNQPNVIQVQETTPALCNSLFLCIYGSSATHGPVYSENGGPLTAFGTYPTLFQQDSTGSSPSTTLEQIGGTNSQTYRLYHSFVSSTNFSRFQTAWDTANGAWQLGSQGGSGGGSVGDIEIATGSTPTPHWHFSASTPYALLPSADGLYDIGCLSGVGPCGANFQVHTIYADNLTLSGTCTGCGSTGVTLQTNGTNNGVQTTLNFITSTVNAAGLAATPSNATSTETIEISGTLAHASLPALVSNDIPNNAANTSGTAANLSGTPTLPSGTVLPLYQNTATAQAAYSGIGSCTNQAVTANNANAAPTCTTITSAYVDSSIGQTTSAGAWMTMPTTGTGTPTTGGTLNRATVWGVNLSFPITTTKVVYNVVVGDTSGGTYDIGLYNNSGVLKVHIGNTAASPAFTATGIHTLSWLASATLQPGRYYLAITCSATALCATFVGASSNAVTFVSNTLVTVTSGGTLSTPITPPSDSITYGAAIPVWIVE